MIDEKIKAGVPEKGGRHRNCIQNMEEICSCRIYASVVMRLWNINLFLHKLTPVRDLGKHKPGLSA